MLKNRSDLSQRMKTDFPPGTCTRVSWPFYLQWHQTETKNGESVVHPYSPKIDRMEVAIDSVTRMSLRLRQARKANLTGMPVQDSYETFVK